MDRTEDKESVISTSSTRSFLSRTLKRKDTRPQQYSDVAKGPLGLTTVFEPGENVAPVADIIFVHGLNGGSQSTWTKGSDLSRFWPKEWLPEDNAFQDTRIHTFGYPSGLSHESILNVRDFAWSLLASIKDSPHMTRDKVRLLFA